MIRTDYHMHTTFCDGKNTPEEMVFSAIAKGMTEIGFSAHTPFEFDCDYTLRKEKVDAYRAEILRLKEVYADKIKILCGIELDLYSKIDETAFDYAIGSVHCFQVKDQYFPVDSSKDLLIQVAKEHYGGDFLTMAEAYYEAVAALAARKIDVVGHFDLIAKFNREGDLFDESDPRYLQAAMNALDALLPLQIPFEINTGAISRGYQDHPYPNDRLLQYIADRGGRVIFNSDAHAAKNIGYDFDKWEDHVRAIAPVVDRLY